MSVVAASCFLRSRPLVFQPEIICRVQLAASRKTLTVKMQSCEFFRALKHMLSGVLSSCRPFITLPTPFLIAAFTDLCLDWILLCKSVFDFSYFCYLSLWFIQQIFLLVVLYCPGMGTRRQWPRPRRFRDVGLTSRDETETRRLQVSTRRDRDVQMHVVINAVVNKLTQA